MERKRIDIAPVEGLNLETGLLLAVLDDVTQEWRGEIGRVSQMAITWQPFPNGHSIGGLLLHIADVEAFWLHEVAAGIERTPEELKTLMAEKIDQYALHWPKPPKRPLAWYYTQQDAIRERTRETVARLNDPDHLGPRGNRNFTLRWLLNHVISHEAYHGGQAVLLSILHKKAD